MTIRAIQLFSLATWIACGLMLGCVKQATPPAEPKATAETKPAVSPPATPPAAPADADPAKTAKADEGKAKAGRKVLLGSSSPELYAGIPGGGDLSDAEIEKWLANPKNHEPLEVELPLGLNAGTRDIVGVKENPLTLAKIELGRQLYFDTRLSKDQTVSCSSCHDPSEDFAAHSQFGIGIDKQQGAATRRFPTTAF